MHNVSMTVLMLGDTFCIFAVVAATAAIAAWM